MWIPGPRLTTVFRSRWRALFWAASVLLSVYFFLDHAPDDTAAPAASADSAASAAPANPWALSSASH